MLRSLPAVAYLTGCGVVCRGPACAEEWDVGRALILAGTAERIATADAADSATLTWTGTEAQGADWALTAGNGELVIGTPGSSEVWILPSDGGGPLVGRPWTDGTTFGFGAAIVRGAGATWVGNPEADLAAGALYRVPLGSDEPDLTVRGTSAGDRLGERIWLCPDLDGDGLEEVAASAPWFAAPEDFPLADPTEVAALGGAVVLLLSAELTADPNRPIWELGRLWWGSAPGDALGAGATCERDLDGDAVPDLALGAPYVGTGDDGAIYLLGGSTLPASGAVSAQADATLLGKGGEWLGFDLGTFRDPRTDAVLLVAGAPGANAGAGAVHTLAVSARNVATQATFEADATATGFHVGRVVTHGDVDGDGREDLLIGAPDWKDGRNGYDAGRAFVLYGGPTWSGVAAFAPGTTWTAAQPFARIGRGIRAFDLDLDGADELLLPARTAVLP